MTPEPLGSGTASGTPEPVPVDPDGSTVPQPPAPPPVRSDDRMVSIPAGIFMMGADDGEEKPHKVDVGAFEIDVTEVTTRAYTACVTANGCNAPAPTVWWQGITPAEELLFSSLCNYAHNDRADHPINCVNWENARSYCAWKKKRLPTEQEWEYAARSGDMRLYPWGSTPPTPKLLNACGSECKALTKSTRAPMYEADDGFGATSPVGSFPAGRSPFGLDDMAGNVWEWTDTTFCPDGAKECDSGMRVSRGGGWRVTDPLKVRATYRLASLGAGRDGNLGFRCAR